VLVAEARNSRNWVLLLERLIFVDGSAVTLSLPRDVVWVVVRHAGVWTREEEQVEHPQVVFLQLQPMAPISYLRFIYATWQCDSRYATPRSRSDIYGIFSAPLPCCRKRLAPDYNQIHYCDPFFELRPAATCEPITAHRRGTDTGHSQNALAGSRNAGCELAHHSSSMAG